MFMSLKNHQHPFLLLQGNSEPALSTTFELDLSVSPLGAWTERTDLALPVASLSHGAVVY